MEIPTSERKILYLKFAFDAILMLTHLTETKYSVQLTGLHYIIHLMKVFCFPLSEKAAWAGNRTQKF